MTSKVHWEMIVAVISTVHMPPDYRGSGTHYDPTYPGDGPIVYVDPSEDLEEILETHPKWLAELAKFIQGPDGETYTWIRFDPDGDVIDGLRKFDWN